MAPAMSKQQQYELVSQSDSWRASEGNEEETMTRPPSGKPSRLWFGLHFVCFALELTFFLLLLRSNFRSDTIKSETIDTTFSYRQASFRTVTKQLNGSLFPPANESWSRRGPGPETDAMWDSFELTRVIPLSADDVRGLGKDPAQAVQFPDDWNDVPKGSYMGQLDTFHKIHCLNQLRKITFEGEPDRLIQYHEPLERIHWRHCIDMIAQDLQCNAKLDVITYNWVDTQQNPFPDFSIERSCTDWDSFDDWTQKNSIDWNKHGLINRPATVVPIPADDGYYELFGFGGSDLYPNGQGYKPRS